MNFHMKNSCPPSSPHSQVAVVRFLIGNFRLNNSRVRCAAESYGVTCTVMIASSPHARRVRSISRHGPVPDSGGKSTESMQAPIPSCPETSFTVPWFARSEVDRPVRTFRWYGTPATNLRIAPSAARSVRGSGGAGAGCETGDGGAACGATRANEGEGAGAGGGRASCVATGACAEGGDVCGGAVVTL